MPRSCRNAARVGSSPDLTANISATHSMLGCMGAALMSSCAACAGVNTAAMPENACSQAWTCSKTGKNRQFNPRHRVNAQKCGTKLHSKCVGDASGRCRHQHIWLQRGPTPPVQLHAIILSIRLDVCHIVVLPTTRQTMWPFAPDWQKLLCRNAAYGSTLWCSIQALDAQS